MRHFPLATQLAPGEITGKTQVLNSELGELSFAMCAAHVIFHHTNHAALYINIGGPPMIGTPVISRTLLSFLKTAPYKNLNFAIF